ncbi:MAG: sulfurtransferase complex subunit TusB [Gammaproteobacteria bacterium]
MLHLISQSPVETAVLERIERGDSVMFFENAVFRILHNGGMEETLVRMLSQCRLFVLSDDLTVRGIRSEELVRGIEVIDYAGLVDLTVAHPLIQTWS